MIAGTCSSMSVTMINGHGLNSCIKKKTKILILRKYYSHTFFSRDPSIERLKNKERQKGI